MYCSCGRLSCRRIREDGKNLCEYLSKMMEPYISVATKLHMNLFPYIYCSGLSPWKVNPEPNIPDNFIPTQGNSHFLQFLAFSLLKNAWCIYLLKLFKFQWLIVVLYLVYKQCWKKNLLLVSLELKPRQSPQLSFELLSLGFGCFW